MEIKKVKRDINNFIITFFRSKQKNKYNYALLYILLDDLQNFVDDKMVEVGNKMLDLNFDKEYILEVKKQISFETTDNENGEFIIE